ncbi:hypothetical protein FSB73_21045 [Arachidicoccus ginsenosidivorans]|uniref:Cytochrome B n=1 Tax=Arachidicoccus ginsenosidivorans TaxID=496057 RepID=A0A5B8VR95_9BACT|nr:hypothetical protein [Arachidicoccus ginsenosidivorans]QEC73783.1 hypothetical protein FSB73_21045 [Arachidicoccus ginsenosidivorans]
MYSILLPLHSLFRWIVLAFLLGGIFRAFIGFIKNRVFSKTDNIFRHWTATVAHIQLLIGMVLYTQSPFVQLFWNTKGSDKSSKDLFFFGVIHIGCMLLAITLITIGSALAKRRDLDTDKFKTMLIWFSIALIVIFMAIPWPFSPLSSRPLL